MSVEELVQWLNPIVSLLTIFFVIIFTAIAAKEGKDERGQFMFSRIYKIMLLFLSTCIAILIFANSWEFITDFEFKVLMILTFGLAYIIGTVSLLIIRTRI